MILGLSIFAYGQLNLRFLTPITISPASPVATDIVTFEVTFKAQNGSVNNCLVIGGVDGSTIYSQTHNLGYGETKTISFTWSATAGNHTVWFHLDPDELTGDKYPENNREELDFTVAGQDIIRQPNLRPFVRYSPSKLLINGTPVTFTVEVKNIGTAEASDKSRMEVKKNGVVVKAFDTDPLPAGVAQTYVFPWTVECGEVVRFDVDTGDSVDESDDGDNHWEKTLDCKKTIVKPDIKTAQTKFVDLKAEFVYSPPVLGRNWKVGVKATNIGNAPFLEPFDIALQYGKENPVVESGFSGLQPGKSTTALFDKLITFEGKGIYNLTGYVDYGNKVKESNEKNNIVYAKNIRVQAPQLTFKNVQVNRSTVRLQQEVRITGMVKNTGNADAYGFKIQADFEKCKGLIVAQGYKIKTITKLNKGDSVNFEFTHRFACLGNKDNYIIVDPDNKVTESDENDNKVLVRVDVK